MAGKGAGGGEQQFPASKGTAPQTFAYQGLQRQDLQTLKAGIRETTSQYSGLALQILSVNPNLVSDRVVPGNFSPPNISSHAVWTTMTQKTKPGLPRLATLSTHTFRPNRRSGPQARECLTEEIRIKAAQFKLTPVHPLAPTPGLSHTLRSSLAPKSLSAQRLKL